MTAFSHIPASISAQMKIYTPSVFITDSVDNKEIVSQFPSVDCYSL